MGGKGRGKREHIPIYSLKISNLHSPQNWEDFEGMKLIRFNKSFTKTLKIPLYI